MQSVLLFALASPSKIFHAVTICPLCERMYILINLVTYSVLAHIAPTGFPVVRVVSVGKKSIELKLEKLDCVEQNGLITGYSVIYQRIMPHNFRLNPHWEVNSTSTKITLGPLDPGTNHSIAVAARNMAGVGPYSPNFHVQTRTICCVPRLTS